MKKQITIWDFDFRSQYPSAKLICKRRLKREKRKKIFVEIPFEVWNYTKWSHLTICEGDLTFSEYSETNFNREIFILIDLKFKSQEDVLYDGYKIQDFEYDPLWDCVGKPMIAFDNKRDAAIYKLHQ